MEKVKEVRVGHIKVTEAAYMDVTREEILRMYIEMNKSMGL
ncbi:hypothetical protein [Paenibacillus sp. NPDC057934]